MSRRQKIIAACALLVLLGALTLWLNPFAPRFEGKTAGEWISICAKDRTRLDDHLVSGFGGAAAPKLLATMSRLHSGSRAIQKICPKWLASFAMRQLDYREKQMVLSEWLALLHFLGEPVLPQVCELRDTSSIMLILDYVDEKELSGYRQQTTNASLRQRAESVNSMRSVTISGGVRLLSGARIYPAFEQDLERIKQRRAANQ